MLTPFQKLYQDNRLQPSISNLLADIRAWEECLQDGSSLRHHLGQFRSFCEKIHQCLMDDFDADRKSNQLQEGPNNWQWAEERLLFESRVISTLVKQWETLRDAASQRVDGSPYSSGLETLDQRALELTNRLVQAIPTYDRADALFPSPPLVCIGPVTKLQIIGDAPAIIRLPFRALEQQSDGSQSRLAVAHELGHVVCERVPDLIDDIQRDVQLSWNDASPHVEALHATMLAWTEEILADLIGTALEGLEFARGAIELALAPEMIAVRTDGSHPVGCLRPFVHFQLLNYLLDEQVQINVEPDTIRDDLKFLNQIVAPLLFRHFELGNVVTALTLATVREELGTFTTAILNARPQAFSGKTVGQILQACAASRVDAHASDTSKLPRWGEFRVEEGQRPVLKLPSEDSLDPITIVFLLALAVGL